MKEYYFDLKTRSEDDIKSAQTHLKESGFNVTKVDNKFDEILELLTCGVIVHNVLGGARFYIEDKDEVQEGNDKTTLERSISLIVGQPIEIHMC